MAYRIEYAPDVQDHLRGLTARQPFIVLAAIDEQLTHQPTVETRNRKPTRPNPIAPWELRVGQLRAYYDVHEQPEALVVVLAVGVHGHRVRESQSASTFEAGEQRRPLAQILRMRQDVHPRTGGVAERFEHLRSAIGRAVINDDDAGHMGLRLSYDRSHCRPVVEHRDDQADLVRRISERE